MLLKKLDQRKEDFKDFPKIQTIMGIDLDQDRKVIDIAGRVSQLTVATNVAGRGIDIKPGDDANDTISDDIKKEIKDAVIKAGGLHEIIPFIPENLRTLEQAIGRTARQGDVGSVSIYVSDDDKFTLTPEFGENYEKLYELQERFAKHLKDTWPFLFDGEGTYNILGGSYPLGVMPSGVLNRSLKNLSYLATNLNFANPNTEKILTDSILNTILLSWGVFFSELQENIDDFETMQEFDTEYENFLADLHENIPMEAKTPDQMIETLSKITVINLVDELCGEILKLAGTVIGFTIEVVVDELLRGLPETSRETAKIAIKEVFENKITQGVLKVLGGTISITTGVAACSTGVGAIAGAPAIVLGTFTALEGINDLWQVIKGQWDAQSINLLKEATGHQLDNVLDLGEVVACIGSAKYAKIAKTAKSSMWKQNQKLVAATSELDETISGFRKPGAAIAKSARNVAKAARQKARNVLAKFRGSKKTATRVCVKDELIKKGYTVLTEEELAGIAGGTSDPNWRPPSSLYGKYATAIDSSVKEITKIPLPQKRIDSFVDGIYRTVITEKEIKLYRVFGGNAGIGGRCATTVKTENKISAKIDLALLPEWKCSKMYEAKIIVPKGEILHIGKVGPQVIEASGTVLEGGLDQIILKKGWPLEWVKNIREIPSK
jgi:hypothetical protein